MIKIDTNNMNKFTFTPEQVEANMANAERTLEIAKTDTIDEVVFDYSYKAIIKAGIALLSRHNLKVKSGPGHHIKIIEALSKLLGDETILLDAEVMRNKRNLDLYSGGVEISKKESAEYLAFAEKVVIAARGAIK